MLKLCFPNKGLNYNAANPIHSLRKTLYKTKPNNKVEENWLVLLRLGLEDWVKSPSTETQVSEETKFSFRKSWFPSPCLSSSLCFEYEANSWRRKQVVSFSFFISILFFPLYSSLYEIVWNGCSYIMANGQRNPFHQSTQPNQTWRSRVKVGWIWDSSSFHCFVMWVSALKKGLIFKCPSLCSLLEK